MEIYYKVNKNTISKKKDAIIGDVVKDKNDLIKRVNGSDKNTVSWVHGKSAASIGEFVFDHNGIKHITEIVNKILSEISSGTSISSFEQAVFEYETKFDKLGKGRMHDLALFGETNNKKKIFVGIEAKVNEKFDSRDIQSAYLSGMLEHVNNRNSNITTRVEDLIKRNNFKEQKRRKDSKIINKFSKEQLGLQYQLLYSTIGTAVENADINILLVLVFKTDIFEEECGARNYCDYIRLMDAITSTRISEDMDLREVKVYTDEQLTSIKTIYAAYEYIEAKGWKE